MLAKPHTLKVILLGCLLPFTGHAQETSIVQYQSVFKDYSHYQDPTVEDWKAANQTVHEIGGWRTYMQEAMQIDKNDTAAHYHSGHDHSGHSMSGGQ